MYVQPPCCKTGKTYGRIDVIFDRYRETSIKSAERQRRCKLKKAIRRSVEGRNVPLLSCWSSFMASQENKADLANFISRELLAQAPPDKEIIVAGGFTDEHQVQSSKAITKVKR